MMRLYIEVALSELADGKAEVVARTLEICGESVHGLEPTAGLAVVCADIVADAITLVAERAEAEMRAEVA